MQTKTTNHIVSRIAAAFKRALLGIALLAVSAASADTYYWDSNNETNGFGNIAGTWAAPTLGTNTAGWSTDANGDTPISGNSVTTTTSDDLFFGTPSRTNGSTITIIGPVAARSIYQSVASGNFAGANQTINFAAEGTYETAKANTAFAAGTTFSGAGTSMAWKVPYSSTCNTSAITTNNAATNILQGPGRLGITAMASLGVSTQPLVFDGGVLRFASGFPIATYSNVTAFSTVHPIIFNLNRNAGFDNQNSTASNQTFTVDVPLALGTGSFSVEGNGNATFVVTNTGNNYSGATLLVGANLQINDDANIGTAAAPIYFNGTLKITGTGMTTLGTRPVVIRGGSTMKLNIDDASNVFTVGQLLTDNVASNGIPLGVANDVAGICGVTKTGLGTLVLTNGGNSYSGLTAVSGGTLVVGANALSLANGALGNTNSEVGLGLASGNVDAGILIGGAFDVGRSIRIATANTTDAGTRVLTLGGNTAHNSIFSTNIFLGTANNAGRGVTLTAAAGGQVTFSGVIQNPGSMDATAYTVTKSGLGTVVLANTNTYSGATTVSAGTLLVNGSIGTNTLTVQANATLGGTGTIKGVVTVANGGNLAPGAGVGTLTVLSNLVLNAGSTNTFEVDGSGPANDQVVLGASVTYDGILKIVTNGTFTAGQTFTLFSGAGATNASNFANPIVGSPGAGLDFSFTNGVLSVVSTISEPAPATLTNSVSGSTLTLTWPAGEGWVLKNQTNSLSTGLNPDTNAWFTVPGGVDGSNSIPIDPSQPTVFYRLVYP